MISGNRGLPCVGLPEAPPLFGRHPSIPQFLKADMEEISTAKLILFIDV